MKCAGTLNNWHVAYFAIYDGHNGGSVSAKLREGLHTHISVSKHFIKDMKQAMIEGCADLDKDIIVETCARINESKNHEMTLKNSYSGSNFDFAGSTAGMMIIHKSSRDSPTTLTVGGIGDSRVVLCRAGQAIDLTHDHKADLRKDEQARIEAAGGFVHKGRVNGVLAVTRSFGDAPHKKLDGVLLEGCGDYTADVVVALPEVHEDTLKPEDEFVILASDGVWDVMSSQEGVNFVRRMFVKERDVSIVASMLVDKALALNSHDNTSAVIVCLNQEFGTEVDDV
eukprot:TRINITY_DN289_c0_g2_i3.p1 TRINITY_DN289_c0_g2~~TRINITY_DN289_c0_g2_i3.p1  ORF type:complete len:283 (-),score=100.87 TRINITY_DN289_c0_g2_i3:304-1152(-)